MADDSARALRALIDNARSIGVLTGAGISTESGIPDYRSPTGIWSQMQPITYQEFVASEEARLEDWRRRFIMNEDFARAEPNAGHRGLVALDRVGKLRGLVTQNIDGLHLRSNCRPRRVVEIHGNATRGACLDCRRPMDLPTVRTLIDDTGRAPRCPSCDGWVKAAVISFGQSLDQQTLEDALGVASDADLFLAIGSSLAVEPAASLPRIAQQSGARLVIVNQEPTPSDAHADLVIHQRIGQVFDSLGPG
ncbi:MAG: Sir2 family NAD-dependent protein deacetylase [Pseudomonadota bacterium]